MTTESTDDIEPPIIDKTESEDTKYFIHIDFHIGYTISVSYYKREEAYYFMVKIFFNFYSHKF